MPLTKTSEAALGPARTLRAAPWLPLLGATLLGALNTLSFAPTPNGGWLELLIVTGLVVLLHGSRSVRGAALRLGAFGFGNLASGTWWLYVSMHDYGGLAAPLAAAAVGLLSLYLAIYPALAGALWYRFAGGIGWRSSFTFAAAWTLGEWLRGLVFTGFPWLASGYPQVDGPLAGLGSIVGVYGVGFMVALVGALFAQALLGWRLLPEPPPRKAGTTRSLRSRKASASASASSTDASATANNVTRESTNNAGGDLGGELGANVDRDPSVRPDAEPAPASSRPRSRPSRARLAPLILALLLLVAGVISALIPWTHPAGHPLRVRLLQGNVKQDMKFEQEGVDSSIALYQALITGHPADLIVTPETAIPLLVQDIPTPFAKTLRDYADQTNTAILFGAVGDVMTAEGPTHFTNSLYGLTPQQKGVYEYKKHHLVPFGEFVPQGFHWFVRMMKIPLGDFDRGTPVQPAFDVQGTLIAPDICYEDIFGEEIADSLRDRTSRAGILINSSNLGWFGNTIALDQHLQMSRMRAIETGRPMLRSTNTGMTAMIDANGVVAGRLEPFTVGSLMGTVQGMEGVTPYILFGNWPIVTGSLLLLFGLGWRACRVRREDASAMKLAQPRV